MKRSPVLSLLLWFCLPVSRVINRINWRFGREFVCKFREIQTIKSHLQPGVVILTHKKYEFSSMFIPGYWTHSAIVSISGAVVEATGKGVRMNTIESFFSTIDDFIILQPCFCSRDTMKKAGEQASALVGYPFSYDFRNTGTKFYCSGLVCSVYTQALTGREDAVNIPFVLKMFLLGNIVKPTDLCSNPDAWEVIGSYSGIERNDRHVMDNREALPADPENKVDHRQQMPLGPGRISPETEFITGFNTERLFN
jgi:hypothetical protein